MIQVKNKSISDQLWTSNCY